MDMQEKVEFVPVTNNINKDRKYFTRGTVFIKEDSLMRRGLNESKFLSKLNHQYIQKYIDSHTKEGVHYLETEYFKGDTLENLKLSSNEITIIQSQMLEVLSYLTTKNIKHGDINVSNVMFDGGSILLIDFETASIGNPMDDLFGEHDHQGVINTIKTIKGQHD
jgi:serine/threonine protein kinase